MKFTDQIMKFKEKKQKMYSFCRFSPFMFYESLNSKCYTESQINAGAGSAINRLQTTWRRFGARYLRAWFATLYHLSFLVCLCVSQKRSKTIQSRFMNLTDNICSIQDVNRDSFHYSIGNQIESFLFVGFCIFCASVRIHCRQTSNKYPEFVW